MSKSSSWGHRVAPLSADERHESAFSNWCSNGRNCPGAHQYECWIDEKYHTRHDPAPEGKRVYRYTRGGRTSFSASYSYVTGRSGRVTTNQRFYCWGCAEKFARKHKLDLPRVEAVTA